MGPRIPPAGQSWSKWRIVRGVGIVAALSATGFWGYQLFVSPPQYNGPEVDLRGKTVLVTEPTARVSRDLLHGLAKRGAQLILACDNVDACANTRDKLLKATRISPSRVDCRRLNTDSTRSIRRFAASLLTDYPQLDRVIIQSPSCITGIVAGKRRPTHDGFEHVLGTNYFASYLLSRLLWPRLSACDDGRLIIVADTSAAAVARANAPRLPETVQLGLPMDDFNFNDTENFDPKLAYQRSQWLLTLFADELARRNNDAKSARIMLVNPVVSVSTTPQFSPSGVQTTFEGLSFLFGRLVDYATRLVKRKVSATTLFCVVADPVVLPPRTSDNSHLIQGAAVFQDLRLISDPISPKQETTCTRSASGFLWQLSEKWTRLDTHPDALPLPPRSVSSSAVAVGKCEPNRDALSE